MALGEESGKRYFIGLVQPIQSDPAHRLGYCYDETARVNALTGVHDKCVPFHSTHEPYVERISGLWTQLIRNKLVMSFRQFLSHGMKSYFLSLVLTYK